MRRNKTHRSAATFDSQTSRGIHGIHMETIGRECLPHGHYIKHLLYATDVDIESGSGGGCCRCCECRWPTSPSASRHGGADRRTAVPLVSLPHKSAHGCATGGSMHNCQLTRTPWYRTRPPPRGLGGVARGGTGAGVAQRRQREQGTAERRATGGMAAMSAGGGRGGAGRGS
jgi:hypothetical protein